MSLGKVSRRRLWLGLTVVFWLALPAWCWAQTCTSCGSFFSWGGHCNHCPRPYKHTFEGPPRIHFHRGCPHPVCNPCDLPHWGYFEQCWSPYPFPPNWSHCPVPPPAAYVTLDPFRQGVQPPAYQVAPYPPAQPFAPGGPHVSPGPGTNGDELPYPRRYDGNR